MLSEETIWLLAQAVGGLLLTVLLIGYIDSAVRGGLLAKQFYPGHFGLLATVVAESPDSMIMADFANKYGETEFSFTGGKNIIEVTANTLKGPSRYWIFTPADTSLQPFSISPATGLVHVVKEGNSVTLRKSPDFRPSIMRCQFVPTADPNGLAGRHVIDIAADDRSKDGIVVRSVLEDVAGRLKALMSQSQIAKGTVDERKQVIAKGDGIVVSLRVDPLMEDRNRIVAYYNPKASEDVRRKSEKLGCALVNALQQETGFVDASAVAPTSMPTLLPTDRPGVEIVVGQLGAKQQLLSNTAALTKAIYSGMGVYYG
jgi:hypothetical protein